MNRGAFSLCTQAPCMLPGCTSLYRACFARSGSHAPALPVLAQSRFHCQRSLCHRRWKLGSLAASAFGLSSFISTVRCVFTASCTAAWLQRFVLVHRLRQLAALSACGIALGPMSQGMRCSSNHHPQNFQFCFQVGALGFQLSCGCLAVCHLRC